MWGGSLETVTLWSDNVGSGSAADACAPDNAMNVRVPAASFMNPEVTTAVVRGLLTRQN